jgi:hypothetical protein
MIWRRFGAWRRGGVKYLGFGGVAEWAHERGAALRRAVAKPAKCIIMVYSVSDIRDARNGIRPPRIPPRV